MKTWALVQSSSSASSPRRSPPRHSRGEGLADRHPGLDPAAFCGLSGKHSAMGFENSVTLKARTSFSSVDMRAPILAAFRLLRRSSWPPAWMSSWRRAEISRYLPQRA